MNPLSTRMLLRLLSFVGLLMLLSSTPATAQTTTSTQTGMRMEESSDPAGWKIYDDDELVAGYLIESNGKPIVYPVIGPNGQAMTRQFPIEDALATEKKDHQHHRSLWFTHGEVNDFDFWADEKNEGDIVHVSGTASTTDDGAAVLVTQNEWISPDGDRIMSDTRRFAFYNDNGRRIIDFDVLLKATDGDVHFGDTKEGSFGVRVAGSMKVDAKLGGIVTSADGAIDSDAWGKPSKWVDYSGPVDSETVGITIHDHPSSFGYPCRWHVRTYGLFAASPFGVHHFTGGEKTNGIVLKDGSKMRLNYRVVLHDGGLVVDVAEKDNADFANDPRPTLQ